MWNWFKRSKEAHYEAQLAPIDMGLVAVDMHSHLLPGIDDGAEDMDRSIDLILHLHAMGYRAAITTPHVFWDMYRNTTEGIRSKLSDVQKELKARNIDFQLNAAAEYYCDEHFENLIEKGDLLTFGKNHVLFEISFAAENANMGRALFNMQLAGYKPILAHPERYEYWHGNLAKYEQLVDRDVDLQLNITSLTGQYGPNVKRMSEKLIDAGLISFLGTDCHHMGHVQLTNTARTNAALHKLIGSGKLKNRHLFESL